MTPSSTGPRAVKPVIQVFIYHAFHSETITLYDTYMQLLPTSAC